MGRQEGGAARRVGNLIEWEVLPLVNHLHERFLQRVPQRQLIEHIRIVPRQIGDDEVRLD